MWTTPLEYTAKDFAEVASPALVFVGDRDELVLVEEAAEMYRQLLNAELAIVPTRITEPCSPGRWRTSRQSFWTFWSDMAAEYRSRADVDCRQPTVESTAAEMMR